MYCVLNFYLLLTRRPGPRQAFTEAAKATMQAKPVRRALHFPDYSNWNHR